MPEQEKFPHPTPQEIAEEEMRLGGGPYRKKFIAPEDLAADFGNPEKMLEEKEELANRLKNLDEAKIKNLEDDDLESFYEGVKVSGIKPEKENDSVFQNLKMIGEEIERRKKSEVSGEVFNEEALPPPPENLPVAEEIIEEEKSPNENGALAKEQKPPFQSVRKDAFSSRKAKARSAKKQSSLRGEARTYGGHGREKRATLSKHRESKVKKEKRPRKKNRRFR